MGRPDTRARQARRPRVPSPAGANGRAAQSRPAVRPWDRAPGADAWAAALETLALEVAVLDGDGVVVAASRGWEASLPGLGLGVGASVPAACDAIAEAGDPAAAEVAAGIRSVLAGGREALEAPCPLPSPGGPRRMEVRAAPDGAGPRGVAVARRTPVPERDGGESAAGVSADTRFRADLLDAVGAAVIAADAAGTVTAWNSAAERLYGWSRQEVLGRPVAELGLVPAGEIPPSVLERGSWEGEFLMTRSDGTTFPAEVRLTCLRDDRGRPAGIVGVSLDVGARVRAERELRAAHEYGAAITESMAEGLFTVDDRGLLTYVNPAAERVLGWSADALLGRPVLEALRPAGAPGAGRALCAVCGPGAPQDAVRVEEELFTTRDGTRIPVEYTSAPIETAAGRGRVVVFHDISARKAAEARLRTELEGMAMLSKIRAALAGGGFELHAQPIVDLRSGAVLQHELLIRMRDPDGGLLSPGAFLPVAERNGLIGEIDRWVVGQAVELAAAGHDVELNLSADSLGDARLLAELEEALQRTWANPARLVIEITETAVLRDEEAARAFIARARELGCRFALDDFGTGYGGFTYLKRLDIDFLKIDREFVRDIGADPASRHVVEAVVSLARGFGLRTVAEGVEDLGAIDLLRRLGVDQAQGFGIARPAPVAEMLPGPASPAG